MSYGIIIGCDENYARPAATTGFSILAHTSIPASQLTFYVVDGGLRHETREKLESSWRPAKTTFIKPDLDTVRSLPFTNDGEASHINTSMWLRVFAPDLLPDHVEIALYADSDILFRGDVAEHFQPNILKGYPIGAVKDQYCPTVSSPSGIPNWEAMGIPPDADNFNSGLLLVDVPAWKRRQLTKQVLHYAREHADILELPDQQSLNAVLWREWKRLDPSWNVLDFPQFDRKGRVEAAEYLATIKGVHFVGPEKPWRTNYVRSYGDRVAGFSGVGLWSIYESQTAWAEAPLEVWQGQSTPLGLSPWPSPVVNDTKLAVSRQLFSLTLGRDF